MRPKPPIKHASTRHVRPRWHEMQAVLPTLRSWQKEVHDGHLSVLLSHDEGQLHLSISHRLSDGTRRPGRYPTWDEIHEARYRFMPDEMTVAMLLPPKADYVNVHPTTFHLWELKE